MNIHFCGKVQLRSKKENGKIVIKIFVDMPFKWIMVDIKVLRYLDSKGIFYDLSLYLSKVVLIVHQKL